MDAGLTNRLAIRLKDLRQQANWSLDQLARTSGVSRATLSRMEKAEVSPTTEMLSKLCAAYGLTLSHLLSMVEENYVPLVHQSDQPVWRDKALGFTRTSISPPSKALKPELLMCEIDAGKEILYDDPTLPGLEHHLYLLEGTLIVTVEETTYTLTTGDCLRYHSYGKTAFKTPADHSARYILVLV